MSKVKNTCAFILLVILVMLFIFPFLTMLSTSFKTYSEAFSTDAGFFPSRLYLGNYQEVFQTIPFFLYMGNTLFVTILNAIGTILVTPMVAFSLTKLNWCGRKYLFPLIISTLLVPYTATMIPLYKFWVKMGMVGTYWPLIIPSFFGYPYYIVIMRQFMLSLPDELFEASKLDGCNTFQRYCHIALPLSKAGITTIFILSFLFTFSDFLGPLLYVNSPERFTLSLGLQAFMCEHTVNWTGLMAAASMFILPVVLLFIFAQRYFVEGIATTGIK